LKKARLERKEGGFHYPLMKRRAFWDYNSVISYGINRVNGEDDNLTISDTWKHFDLVMI